MKMKIGGSVLVVTAIILISGCSSVNDGQTNVLATYAPKSQDTSKNIQNSQSDNSGQNNQSNNTINNKSMNSNQNGPGDNSELVKKYSAAVIKTSMGDIKVKLNGETTPITAGNFLKLAQTGVYDGTKFHRVIKGFMIQGGDPNSKNSDTSNWGMGGPGYKFNDELKGTEKYSQGTLAMANSGPNTNGSQFFIVTASPEAPLPPSYTVFGSVVEGMDVALKIENVKTSSNDRPVENVVINRIEVSEK